MLRYDPQNPPTPKEIADDLMGAIADQLPELARSQAESTAKQVASEIGKSTPLRTTLRDAIEKEAVAYISAHPEEVVKYLFDALCRNPDLSW